MDEQRMEALASIVDEADEAGGPTPEQQAEAKQAEAKQQAASELDEKARQWGVLAYMIGGGLAMAAPELRQVYTEAACLDWGRSVVPVAEKYGWDGGPSKLPELGLMLSTAMLAIPTVYVLRARLAEARPEDAGKPGPGGLLAGIKAWWRDKRAAKAAAVVRDKVQDVSEAMGKGATHGSQQ